MKKIPNRIFAGQCVLALLLGFVRIGIAADTPRLNVILILADDLGWKDLGCYGSDLYQSPNIDKLARDGMKFTQSYSACTVCSPTRAAIMTGKYPARLHITDWIPGLPPENPKLLVPDWTKYLPLEQKTTRAVAQADRAGLAASMQSEFNAKAQRRKVDTAKIF